MITKIITDKVPTIGSIPSARIYPGNGIQYKIGTDRVCIIICTNGEAEIEMDSKIYNIYEKIFLVAGPEKTISMNSSSKNFRGDIYYIHVDSLPIEELKHVYSLKRIYNEEPCYKIPDEKYIMCRFIGHYLKSFQSEDENTYKIQIMQNYLNILFYEACNIFLNREEKKAGSKNRYLTNRFFADIESNFKTNRKISFYAQKLGITPKYLSFLVAKETGRTATRWIEEYTLLEAKKMLRSGKMTIYQIAYELSFSTPSHFGTFFRKHTGKTPKEFIKSTEITSRNEAFPQE